MLTFRALRIIKRGREAQDTLPEGFGNFIPEDDETSTHITDVLTRCTPRSVYYAWYSIMEQYSEKELTNRSDRLAAVSGLASLIVEYLGLSHESYLAGLWRADFVEGLLWYVKSGPKIHHRPHNLLDPRSCYVAPTWSWASVDGRIEYFKERYQFQFRSSVEILEATCKSLPEDYTGRVTSGHIILSGMMVPVSLKVDVFSSLLHHSQYDGKNGSASRTHLDQFTSVQSLASRKKVAYEVLCDESMEIGSFSSSGNRPETMLWMEGGRETRYYCLQVGITIDIETGGKRYWWLVLRRATHVSEFYQRVGLGYFQTLSRSFHLFESATERTVHLI